MHDLQVFMAQVTSEMASEYKRIFAKTAEDPGTAGDEGEENWAQLLREWLPPAYHVATKGRLIGADGAMSPQIDILVLKPFYPQKLREKKVWLANGVAAVFECKTTLRSEHIAASSGRCFDFKKLFPRRKGSPARELRSPLFYGMLAHSHAWKTPASKPGDNVDKALNRIADAACHPADLIDSVCVADTGCWSGLVMPRLEARSIPSISGKLQSLFEGAWGAASAMVRSMIEDSSQPNAFQPVGGMLAYLTQRLAWEDPSIRDLADYYDKVNMWGDSTGRMRYWPQAIYSDEVRQKLSSEIIKNSQGWDEWSANVI